MSLDEPQRKRLCLGEGSSSLSNHENLHEQIENCFPHKCLCSLSESDLKEYINRNLRTLKDTKQSTNNLLFLSFISWLSQSFHDQLSSGFICSSINFAASFLLNKNEGLEILFRLLEHEDENIQFSTVQALSSILPLCHCGLETTSTLSTAFVKFFIHDLVEKKDVKHVDNLLDLVAPGEEAGLDDLCFDEPVEFHRHQEAPTSIIESLEYKSLVLSVLSGLVTHSDKQSDDGSSVRASESCRKLELSEDALCQETQVKCLVIKMLDPVWPIFTQSLVKTLNLKSYSLAAETYLCEGFKLWQSLISVRANLSFVESRMFSSDLASVLPRLTGMVPGSVWRSALDTVSECLCYGTTLGLQSIPPQEPCDLAHTLIRIVRFNNYLAGVPYKGSLGMGGNRATDDVNSDQYDKGLVQKMVLILLKCVALTTREARVESSSGESDSSASSRESVSSGGSDMVIIHRTMSGMYKVLDSWIKQILPVLPDQSLQESLLHILQEQDDVLIEGLLCLLDTHVALYVPGKEPESALLDTNPARGFLHLVSIVSRDSSVLLDFLVSNETCFLLYFLRLLKFITKNWPMFETTCGAHYTETTAILLELKQSIQRLMSKSLFPYNIGPVFRLLEKVEALHLHSSSIKS